MTATSWVPIIIIGLLALAMAAVLIYCAVLLARGIKQQQRYNNTALPSLVQEAQELEEENDEEESAFDLESAIEEDFEDEGYDSDKWFAQSRDIDEEDLKDIRKRRNDNKSMPMPGKPSSKPLPSTAPKKKNTALPKL